jgi:hypothetical protein
MLELTEVDTIEDALWCCGIKIAAFNLLFSGSQELSDVYLCGTARHSNLKTFKATYLFCFSRNPSRLSAYNSIVFELRETIILYNCIRNKIILFVRSSFFSSQVGVVDGQK